MGKFVIHGRTITILPLTPDQESRYKIKVLPLLLELLRPPYRGSAHDRSWILQGSRDQARLTSFSAARCKLVCVSENLSSGAVLNTENSLVSVRFNKNYIIPLYSPSQAAQEVFRLKRRKVFTQNIIWLPIAQTAAINTIYLFLTDASRDQLQLFDPLWWTPTDLKNASNTSPDLPC